MDALKTQLAMNVGTIVISILGALAIRLIRAGKVKVETAVAQVLPAEDAVKVNDLIDAIDSLAEAAVQDANSRIVNGLKAQKVFDAATAQSVKASVVSDVLTNLGSLKDKAAVALGSVEKIVGQYVEKHVLTAKSSVNAKTPA